MSRPEYEYEIPLAQADEMLDTPCAEGRVEKYRHRVADDVRYYDASLARRPWAGWAGNACGEQQ